MKNKNRFLRQSRINKFVGNVEVLYYHCLSLYLVLKNYVHSTCLPYISRDSSVSGNSGKNHDVVVCGIYCIDS